MEDSMKEFIEKNPVLRRNNLARMIDWAPSSFSSWLAGRRPIPADKAEALKSVLEKYGYYE